ncbi:MAG: hypothetical protein JNM89_16000 [Hyphomicrobiaceae bacterium]|nr:hypothetical protein [Hyphomicrobiaceae bacterium]
MATPNNETPAGPDIASPAAPQQSAPTDDLDGLLREFDSGSGSAKAPQGGSTARAAPEPVSPGNALETPPTFADRILQLATEHDRRLAEALSGVRHDADESAAERSDRLTQLEQFAAGIEHERFVQRERADAEAVFSHGSEILGEVAPWLPGDYAKTWLLNEARTDGDLAEAWESRYESPEHAARARQEIGRAMKRFNAHLRSLPDPVLTSQREIVSASVRGAALDKAPKPAPLRFDGMSDYDFAGTIEKKFGFRPRV